MLVGASLERRECEAVEASVRAEPPLDEGVGASAIHGRSRYGVVKYSSFVFGVKAICSVWNTDLRPF